MSFKPRIARRAQMSFEPRISPTDGTEDTDEFWTADDTQHTDALCDSFRKSNCRADKSRPQTGTLYGPHAKPLI
jgi:hypothetical protein